MYKTIDLRDMQLLNVAHTADIIFEYRKDYPELNSIIISRSQREALVKSDPVMYAQTLQMSKQFGKAPSDLDFQIVLEGCRVEVE